MSALISGGPSTSKEVAEPVRNIAIRAEGLGKRYRLGTLHAGMFRYKSLRDVISGAAGRMVRRRSRCDRTPRSERGHIWALDDVSFEIAAGEVVGVIGRNGAGKSTLLKILSRITEPTTGEVHIRGRVGSLLEIGTGFHPELTGRENIYLNGAILGMRRREIDAAFTSIVEFAEIERFLDTPVKHYSSGMYTRLAFSVAAHLEPEILLVDEVLAVGDADFQARCLRKMGDVSREGRTVLFVSHNLGSIQQLCTRALLFDKGKVVQDGAVQDVVLAYLRMGIAREGERVWTDSEAPGDDVVKLRGVRARGKSGEIGTAFTVRDPISIEVDFEILRECPIDVFLFVSNELGVAAFVSADNKDSPWRDTRRPPGLYRSSCRIPGDFLNSGQYSITVHLSQTLDKGMLHGRAADAIWLAVSDSADPEGVRGNYGPVWPAAAVRPRLGWESERIYR